MEGDSQIRDLTELLRLLLLYSHLEDLALTCSINQEIADLLHARDREIRSGFHVCLFIIVQVSVPLSIVCVNAYWQVTLKQFEGVPQLTGLFVMVKLARHVSYDEIITSESEDVLDAEVGPWRVDQHKLKVAVLVAE